MTLNTEFLFQPPPRPEKMSVDWLFHSNAAQSAQGFFEWMVSYIFWRDWDPEKHNGMELETALYRANQEAREVDPIVFQSQLKAAIDQVPSRMAAIGGLQERALVYALSVIDRSKIWAVISRNEISYDSLEEWAQAMLTDADNTTASVIRAFRMVVNAYEATGEKIEDLWEMPGKFSRLKAAAHFIRDQYELHVTNVRQYYEGEITKAQKNYNRAKTERVKEKFRLELEALREQQAVAIPKTTQDFVNAVRPVTELIKSAPTYGDFQRELYKMESHPGTIATIPVERYYTGSDVVVVFRFPKIMERAVEEALRPIAEWHWGDPRAWMCNLLGLVDKPLEWLGDTAQQLTKELEEQDGTNEDDC